MSRRHMVLRGRGWRETGKPQRSRRRPPARAGARARRGRRGQFNGRSRGDQGRRRTRVQRRTGRAAIPSGRPPVPHRPRPNSTRAGLRLWKRSLLDPSRVRRFVVGGRSSGARVLVGPRTHPGGGGALPRVPAAAAWGARKGDLSRSRLGELEAVPISVPTLVVQGARDPFGMPPPARNRSVVAIAGTHALSSTEKRFGRPISRRSRCLLANDE